MSANWQAVTVSVFQHVNNTVYFRYFKDVRGEFFSRFGVNEYKAQHNIGPILATTKCDFRLPLAFPDRVRIGARYTISSPKKISMEYVVYSEKEDATAAQGEGFLVCFDCGPGKSCDIPPDVLTRIELR